MPTRKLFNHSHPITMNRLFRDDQCPPQSPPQPENVSSNHSSRTPSAQSVLEAFHNKQYGVECEVPISPWILPNLSSLPLEDLPTLEDEISNSSLQEIVDRLHEGNKLNTLNPNPCEQVDEIQVEVGEEHEYVSEPPETHAERSPAGPVQTGESPTQAVNFQQTGQKDENQRKSKEDQEDAPGVPEIYFDYSPADSAEWTVSPVKNSRQMPEVDALSTDEIPNPIWESHGHEFTPNPEDFLQVKQMITEEARTAVKEEAEMAPMAEDESEENIQQTPVHTGQEEVVEASEAGGVVESANDEHASSTAHDQNPNENVNEGSPSEHRLQRSRRRGVKRGRCEVETSYWLRSKKPPSSSKRSRRTRYWLRP